jgi:Ca2+-binding EF-hand superfamily protein
LIIHVVPETYNGSLVKEDKQETEGLIDIIGLPEYKIEIPSDKLIRCLDIIDKRKDGRITKRELKDLVVENNLMHIDNQSSRAQYSDQAAGDL